MQTLLSCLLLAVSTRYSAYIPINSVCSIEMIKMKSYSRKIPKKPLQTWIGKVSEKEPDLICSNEGSMNVYEYTLVSINLALLWG